MAAVGKQDAVSPQTVKEACMPRPGVFDPSRRDTVLDLTDLIDGRIDPGEFFAENYLTEGMRTLLTEGFRRLEGKSAQGVFKLTQAMGGGKTHNLLAFGLLARHPQYRAEVMGGFHPPDAALGPVRVVAFSGRESDAPLGVWGAIAEQLGQRERFNDYYAPLSAPGQSAWVNLLQGRSLLIMLDELPPYFVNAAARSIGNSDLSAVTTTALSNLLVAVGRDELRNVCVVISDLTATYGAGGAQIVTALNDLEAETGRSAMNLEPVRMNSDEFYHILRRRLFERLPDDAAIAAVAQAYGAAVREAKQMDVTNASPEQFAAAVKESYPFHPAIRDLYARFRENQGFQQTRGLIRLMRIVVARIWADDRAPADRAPCLIAAHHLDLGSRETLTEINQINNTLGNAVAHDIASGGASVAERLDANLGGGRDAQDVMRLLLIASLANVPNAVKGLAVPEIVAYLCAPGRDVSRLKNEVIARLTTAAWYLHGTNDGRLHLRNVQNLNARVSTTARAYLRDQATREVEARLTEIFRPDDGACYQRLMPLPAVDRIDAGAEQVTLVVAEPHPAGLHPDLRTLYDQHTFRNRLCFLTGERAFDALLESARDLKAVNQIIEEMHEEGVADGDTQMQQAREQLLPRFLARFHSAIRETFTTLYYPTRDRLARVDFMMEFRGNRYDGEEQVREALAGRHKYTTDVAGDTFRRKVEALLFTQQSLPWAEIRRRAATAPGWQWHRPDALDRLKADCLHKDLWREEGSYVNKGPFPKPATAVRVQELDRDDDTGVAKLRLRPVNGDELYAEVGAAATPASRRLDPQQDFETADLRVSLLAVDSTGQHETGEAVEWINRITLQSRQYDAGGGRMVELRAAPPAPIRYTTDGSDPNVAGGVYDEPFAVPAGSRLVLAVAARQGIVSDLHRRDVAEAPVSRPIERSAPATWTPAARLECAATRATYDFIARLRRHAARAGGLRVSIQTGGARTGAAQTWSELSLSDDIELTGDELERIIEALRPLVAAGEVAVDAKRMRFETGQRFLDYVEDARERYDREEVDP